ncbi:MAG TPA: EAL domain-containing protein, partial [Acidobacteriota bacterium]|nr:EAL domain-containing protein [Acidobacteriota bacterium]
REYYLFRIREQKAVTNFEQRLRRKDGSPVWVLENVSLLPDQFEGSQVMEGTAVDITDRKKAEDQIAFQAYHDALTGLPNRNLFRDRLIQAVAQATRNRDGLAVLFLDLDHFKLINDTLGHSLGDWLLTRVAERLRKIVREVDTVARLGGDEFIVLLPGIRAGEDAARVAQKVLSGIDDPFRHETQDLFVTTSIGISLFPADGEDAETLIRSADNAMYRAKELGRNNYHLFSPSLNLRVQTRLSWERDLRRAVDRQEFVMYYQPQIQLQTGRIIGLEALIRWQHPDKGLVLPNSFIHVAEETRLIFPIGQWAVHTACRQLKEWQNGGFPHLQVSINLSARQFQHEGLMDFVQKTLAETGLSPSSLVVEITESIAMQNVELTLSVLKQLRKFGIRIALDDFGIGYSSLSYLKHFPVDIIKIDTTFVRDVGHGQEEDALVRAVIQLGANMNRQVIAEGIETSEQRNFLLQEGCDLAQGFLFSPAVPPDEALVLLKDGKL